MRLNLAEKIRSGCRPGHESLKDHADGAFDQMSFAVSLIEDNITRLPVANVLRWNLCKLKTMNGQDRSLLCCFSLLIITDIDLRLRFRFSRSIPGRMW